jgi:hypothetical protein
MIKTLTHPLYLVAIILAATNQLIERNGIFIPFIHAYLDDFLCFPIVLTTGLAAYRWLWPYYTLGPWHIWPMFAFFVVYFEIYLPSTSTVYTSDFWDVLAYFLGILVFKTFINQMPTKEKTPQLAGSSSVF